MIFDQYQRYKTVEVIISYIKDKLQKKKVTILEIGSNEECNLEKVLPNDTIQYSDMILTAQMENDGRFIALNGSSMPEIADDQYDIVVALDVLEHVPEGLRGTFIRELSRVAEHMAILCFPYKTNYNESAEKRVNGFYKMLYGEEHKWLTEHIQNGLPQISEVERQFLENNISFKEFYHGDIFLWEDMMKGLFSVYGLQRGGEYFEQINKLYEEQVYFNDKSAMSYRVFVMLSEDEILLQDVESRVEERYTDNIPEKANRLIRNCIDDIKYCLINERGRKVIVRHQVYFKYGEDFNENDKTVLLSESLNANSIHINHVIKIKEKCKAVRFDPVEGERCILKKLQIESNAGKIDYAVKNGERQEDNIIFFDDDPQIYIDFESREVHWIHIYAELLRTEFPEAIIIQALERKIDCSLERERENLIETMTEKLDEVNRKIEEIRNRNLREILGIGK